MALTDVRVRRAKPRPTGYRLLDGDGLHLWVAPTGAKSWRWRYQRDGRERLVTLGRYPGMGLAEARRKREALATAGGQAASRSASLRDTALQWHSAQRPLWKPHHAADVLATLEREIFPELGERPIGAITAPMILAALRPVQERGAVELAHRLVQRLAAVWAYAIASGQASSNPAAGLGRALMPIVRKGRRPAAIDLDGARAVLKAAEAIPAHPVTRLALRLLALTAVRPGELRLGLWAEIEGLDGDAPVWRIPAARMKHRLERQANVQDHVAPLSTHAVEVVRVLHKLTGRSALLFPSWSNARQPMSENGLIYHLHRAGQAQRHVPHGWRATFSTVMNEARPADRHVIDAMLAHAPKDRVEAAYNRARYANRRREIAQEWGDMLMAGMPPAEALLELPRR